MMTIIFAVQGWSLEGDKRAKTRYLLTDDGTIKKISGNDVDEAIFGAPLFWE